MPRKKRHRRILSPPRFSGYKPLGLAFENRGYIELLYEEYEAIKLADYDGMKHEEASELMGVSRATFARIYEEARKKISKALVEAKEIRAVFGNVIIDKNWFVCKECKTRFTIPSKIKKQQCPLCSSEKVNLLNQ